MVNTIQEAGACQKLARYSVAEWGAGSKNSGEPFTDLVMLVNAYFDDSTDDKRKRFVAVGGLIGNSTQWSMFDDWWGILTSGIPGHFHATDCDCNPPRGAFKGWTKPECDALMRELVNTIQACHLSGFGSVVPVPEFREVFPDSDSSDPYLLALTHTLINMAEIGRQIASSARLRHLGRPDGLQVWVEEGDTDIESLRLFKALKSNASWDGRQFLKSFATADKSVMAMQGADLVAREAFKHADNRGIRPTRKPMKEMKGRMSFHVWNRECLEYLKSAGGPENLDFLVEWPNKRPRTEMPEMLL